MNKKEGFQYFLEAVIWYLFIYYWLLVITTGTDMSLWIDSLILLVLAYVGILVCPWTKKFEKHMEKDKKKRKKK